MKIFVCPREWTHATERFTPNHLISLQNPAADISGLRPDWIPPENHHVSYFYDVNLAGHHLAPTYQQIEALLSWMQPICQPDSQNKILIHCDAGLGRSTATGYLAWALHLGSGQEELAFKKMVASCLQSQLVPNSVIVAHADAILARDGALKKQISLWNSRVAWRRSWR